MENHLAKFPILNTLIQKRMLKRWLIPIGKLTKKSVNCDIGASYSKSQPDKIEQSRSSTPGGQNDNIQLENLIRLMQDQQNSVVTQLRQVIV